MRTISSIKMSKREAGFSLTELMIAVTIGMLILAGLAGVFSTTSRSRAEVERGNRQVENGRYAVQLLAEDLRLAGFWGEFDPSKLATPATKPNPCSAVVADLRAAIPVHLQGYDDGDGAPTCLQDVRADTDIVVVRRASTCVAGTTDCDTASSGTAYFQASLCYPTAGAVELASGNPNQFFALDTTISALTMRQRNCTTTAGLRRYVTHIYFVANNNNASDGIPTLKRAELSGSQMTIVPLVEGIENLQLEYGIDTDAIGTEFAGSPNAYTTSPDSYNGCIGSACVDNWRGVVAVKLHVLARNTEKTAGYTDTKTYTLGMDSAGLERVVGPFNDSFKRHVYQSSIRLSNPAGRREP